MLTRHRLKEALVAAKTTSKSLLYHNDLRMWISWKQQIILWSHQHPLIANVVSYIRRSSVFFISLYFSFILTGYLINIYKLPNSNVTGDKRAPEFRPGNIGELCQSKSNATEKKIFFIETSGGNCLRSRQACAIESAARTNPDMKIQVYVSTKIPGGTPEQDGGYGLQRHCESMNVLTEFPNVQIIREDLTRHVLGTPLESLLNSGKFEKSQFSYQHVSDAIRIALLYKFGGIYLDLDVVVLRSLGCLRNTAGEVRSSDYKAGIENGVLIFDKGHELLGHYMRLMEQIYDPLSRESIGPAGFLKATGEFCGFGICEGCDFGQLWICRDNWNITVLYTEAFYPIPFRNRERFYDPNFHLKELDHLQTSYLVHVYGAGHGAQVVPSSLYGFLAQRFCPSVYSASSLAKSLNHTF